MSYQVRDDGKLCDPTLYRERGQEPEGILMHTTDGRDSQAWLQGASIASGHGASCDFLITRLGLIVRLVPKGTHSYHAGICRYNGVMDRSNMTSRKLIGIEVENYDRAGEVPTEPQHGAAAGLILAAATKYKWSPLKVYGHYALASPMGRRSDPHAWDWGYMMWLMAHAKDKIALRGASPF